MPLQDLSVYVFLITGVIFSIHTEKLTTWGSITGSLIGLFVYKGAEMTGVAMLAAFFLLGSFATKWLLKKKQRLGIAEKNGGQRTAPQVIANGGVAAILGAIAWYKPQYTLLLQLMVAGSLASATADTLSSELGSLYGTKFLDILSFKKSNPGPDGVISLEGTLIGILGAGLIALVYAISLGFNFNILVIIAAGALGNLIDSVLGATLERKCLINNNTVNFLNTTAGAFFSWLLYISFIK